MDLFLALPIKTASKKAITKHNIQKTHIHIFHNTLLRKVTIILDLFLNFSNSIRIHSPEQSYLLKILIWKQLQNNLGLSLLTSQLWRKTKHWHKKYKKRKFCTQRRPKILSLHKFLEKYNEQTLWNFCIFTLLGAIMSYLFDFKQNKNSP